MVSKRGHGTQWGPRGKGFQYVKPQAFDKCVTLEIDQGLQALEYFMIIKFR